MNADKMTREEFDGLMILVGNEAIQRAGNRKLSSFTKSLAVGRVWDRFDAIQSAPFVPDWNLKPEWAKGFWGTWTPADINPRPGEFYIPAPSHDEKVQMVGEGVSRNDEPFCPDWSLKPISARSFRGSWSSLEAGDCTLNPGEFVIPAPTNPTDAELSAMWEKLDRDKRVQILRDAGVEV